MNTKYTTGYANKLLDALVELDVSTNAAYYEMGRILSAFRKNTLWDIIGYESMAHMVEEELSFAPGTASHYSNIYNQLKRLKYNKTDSLKLINKYSMSRLLDVLPDMKSKISDRAVGDRIKNLDVKQLNFLINSKEWTEVQRALAKLGATRTASGRYKHSSEAFMSMIREVNKQPPLKNVA